jgi:hypothetical protein
LSKAQSRNNSGPCGEAISVVLVYGGILFEPLNEVSNKRDRILCKEYSELFYLNGLQLNKDQFINLALTSCYLSNDSTFFLKRGSSKRGYGTYEYELNEFCVNHIIYRANVKLPIILNGNELSADKQEETLSTIPPSEILSIERKGSFLGRTKIYIETRGTTNM